MLKASNKLLFLILLCNITHLTSSIAQDKFSDGFIITKQQDTIPGLIKEQFSASEYNILFKSSDASEEIAYTPGQISQYFLNDNQLFESHSVQLVDSKEEVFVRCLIKGTVNLYTYIDRDLVRHFYILTKENGMRKLRSTDKIIKNEFNRKKYRHKKKEYVGELMIALAECKKLTNEINKVALKESALVALIKKYHDCTNRDFIDFSKKQKRSKQKIEFGILAGVNQRFEKIDIADQTKIGGNLNPFVRFFIPNSRNRYSVELRYNWSTIGINDKRLKAQSIQFRVNQYFKRNENSLYPKVGVDFNVKNYDGNGVVLGLGYDLKINKLKFITNLEYRFFYSKVFNLNMGFSF